MCDESRDPYAYSRRQDGRLKERDDSGVDDAPDGTVPFLPDALHQEPVRPELLPEDAGRADRPVLVSLRKKVPNPGYWFGHITMEATMNLPILGRMVAHVFAGWSVSTDWLAPCWGLRCRRY